MCVLIYINYLKIENPRQHTYIHCLTNLSKRGGTNMREKIVLG